MKWIESITEWIEDCFVLVRLCISNDILIRNDQLICLHPTALKSHFFDASRMNRNLYVQVRAIPSIARKFLLFHIDNGSIAHITNCTMPNQLKFTQLHMIELNWLVAVQVGLFSFFCLFARLFVCLCCWLKRKLTFNQTNAISIAIAIAIWPLSSQSIYIYILIKCSFFFFVSVFGSVWYTLYCSRRIFNYLPCQSQRFLLP